MLHFIHKKGGCKIECMCGRFTQTTKPKDVEKEFSVKVSDKTFFKPRYNIAPTQIIPAVLEQSGERIVNQLRWGLIPSWAKDDSISRKLINARADVGCFYVNSDKHSGGGTGHTIRVCRLLNVPVIEQTEWLKWL